MTGAGDRDRGSKAEDRDRDTQGADAYLVIALATSGGGGSAKESFKKEKGAKQKELRLVQDVSDFLSALHGRHIGIGLRESAQKVPVQGMVVVASDCRQDLLSQLAHFLAGAELDVYTINSLTVEDIQQRSSEDGVEMMISDKDRRQLKALLNELKGFWGRSVLLYSVTERERNTPVVCKIHNHNSK